MSCLDNSIIEPKMSASFVPDHKAPMVLFLDRVYGIDNQDFLLHVLEVGFLPDMRAAASLDTVRFTHPQPRIRTTALCWTGLMALVSAPPGCLLHHGDGPGPQPLPVFRSAATHHQMRPPLCRQRPPGDNDRLHAAHHLQAVSWASLHQGPKRYHRGVPHGFVQVGLTPDCCQVCPMKTVNPLQLSSVSLRHLRPSMLQHLLRRLVFDVPILNEYAKMPLKARDAQHVLTLTNLHVFSGIVFL